MHSWQTQQNSSRPSRSRNNAVKVRAGCSDPPQVRQPRTNHPQVSAISRMARISSDVTVRPQSDLTVA